MGKEFTGSKKDIDAFYGGGPSVFLTKSEQKKVRHGVDTSKFNRLRRELFPNNRSEHLAVNQELLLWKEIAKRNLGVTDKEYEENLKYDSTDYDQQGP